MGKLKKLKELEKLKELKPNALPIIGGRASRSTTLRKSAHYELGVTSYELGVRRLRQL